MVYGFDISGELVNSLKSMVKVRGCSHDLPSDPEAKFCSICGKSIWREEEGSIEDLIEDYNDSKRTDHLPLEERIRIAKDKLVKDYRELVYSQREYSDSYIIGRSPMVMYDDETLNEFKSGIAADISKILGTKIKVDQIKYFEEVMSN